MGTEILVWFFPPIRTCWVISEIVDGDNRKVVTEHLIANKIVIEVNGDIIIINVEHSFIPVAARKKFGVRNGIDPVSILFQALIKEWINDQYGRNIITG